MRNGALAESSRGMYENQSLIVLLLKVESALFVHRAITVMDAMFLSDAPLTQ